MATTITSGIGFNYSQKGGEIIGLMSEVSPDSDYFSITSVDYASLVELGQEVFVRTLGTTAVNGTIYNVVGDDIIIYIEFGNYFLPSSFNASVSLIGSDLIQSDVNVNVVAAYNPVVIELRRADISINSEQSDWNSDYIQFDAGSISDEFIVGDLIPVSNTNEFLGYLEILDKTGDIVTIDFAWTLYNPFMLIYVNSIKRLNWYLNLVISKNPFISTSESRVLRLTPNEQGIMRAEISGALRSLLNLNFSTDATPDYLMHFEKNLYTPFYFSTKENWLESNEEYVNYFDDSEQYFAVAGAFQVADQNNGYYAKYFANNNGSDSNPDLLPKWLTEFESPRYFVGFPFSVNYIATNQELSNYSDFYVSIDYYRNNGLLSSQTSDSLFEEFQCNQRINLVNMTSELIESGDIDRVTYLNLMLGSDEPYDSFKMALSPLRINVTRTNNQDCNTFYVRWLNNLGGWDYWLFETRIYEGIKVESGGVYENYFDSIAAIDGFQNVNFKKVIPSVQVGADLITGQEVLGLKSLLTSPKVYWYNEELETWISVIVEPGSFAIRKSKSDYFKVELTINKPQQFNQFA